MNLRLSGLVNEVADATPERTNLASTLRTFACRTPGCAARRCSASSTACPWPATPRTWSGCSRRARCPASCSTPSGRSGSSTASFALWLNLDPRATVGQRLDNIMILRGQNLKEMWAGLGDGRLTRGALNATYVSPGKVRTSQATALALANGGGPGGRAAVAS